HLLDMTEIGPGEVPRLPSFQLNRPVLDDHLCRLAAGEGCHVLRPAKVAAAELGWPESRLRLEAGGQSREVSARWVVDASGRQAFLARKLGLHQRVDRHPTAAVWARFAGVPDLDGADFLGQDPRGGRLPPISASRRLATNHFCGYGWWCWVIPLSDGHTSIGVVYHKELFDLPGEGGLRDRFSRFLHTTPGLRDLVSGAELVRLGRDGHGGGTAEGIEDFMALGHLPYRTERYMGRGWALVSDAAAFLGPYYSPGLDHASISVWATVRLLEQELGGELGEQALDAAIERHNVEFLRSYDRWLDALYVGKYEILGDAELVRSAFLVDTALYYLGVVTPITRQLEALGNPVFGLGLPQATYAYRLTRAFNRRLRKLARFRRRAGTYGRANLGRRLYSRAFDVGPRAAWRPLRTGLGIWLRIELEQILYRLRHGRVDTSAPVAGRDEGGPAVSSPAPAG
ncbi:MAG: tryptophan 7-halogenase, partial [Holophagales bacterium]|nr:tryptophan 7-halogenase [Holophagales bacterium]